MGLLGISVATVRVVAVRLRLIYMLEHDRCGGNHSLFEGSELGVGHVAEPFGYCVGRKMQVQRLRWATITAVEKRRRGVVARRAGYLVLVNSTKVSTAKPEYLRVSPTRLGVGRRSAAVRSGAYTGGTERSFGRPRGLPDSPLTKRPFVVRFTLRPKPINPPSNLLRS